MFIASVHFLTLHIIHCHLKHTTTALISEVRLYTLIVFPPDLESHNHNHELTFPFMHCKLDNRSFQPLM